MLGLSGTGGESGFGGTVGLLALLTPTTPTIHLAGLTLTPPPWPLPYTMIQNRKLLEPMR